MESSSSSTPQLGITQRLRRLRTTPIIRTMVREHDVQLRDLVYPLFIEENLSSPVPITGLPG